MGHKTDGILLIDKQKGVLSYEVVRRIKKVLGQKKAGHAGTLDPFATGLLIILLGQGTRLSNLIMSQEKLYEGIIHLGVVTDSYDVTGKVLSVKKVPPLDSKFIQDKANGFTGDIDQVPPIYSAVKHHGIRAYKLARKGKEVELKKRRVTVSRFEILEVNLPYLYFRVRCSSGTYIRSLAHDLGEALGTGGHLRSLRRLTSGSFHVEAAYDSEKITDTHKEDILKGIIPLKSSLPHLKEVNISRNLAERIRNGYQPQWKDLGIKERSLDYTGFIKVMVGDDLVAILRVTGDKDSARENRATGLKIHCTFRS